MDLASLRELRTRAFSDAASDQPLTLGREPRDDRRQAFKSGIYTMATVGNYYDGGRDRHEAFLALIVEAVNSLPSLLNRLEQLEELADAAEHGLGWLAQAIETLGFEDEDELIQSTGNEWTYVICARDEIRLALAAVREEQA